ncbi:MAG: metallophosphoesterase family protein [Gammaproteobacteria bacterium]|nr:metallophosphoesterase family protein [Gammaproteobacteria bacterium]
MGLWVMQNLPAGLWLLVWLFFLLWVTGVATLMVYLQTWISRVLFFVLVMADLVLLIFSPYQIPFLGDPLPQLILAAVIAFSLYLFISGCYTLLSAAYHYLVIRKGHRNLSQIQIAPHYDQQRRRFLSLLFGSGAVMASSVIFAMPRVVPAQLVVTRYRVAAAELGLAAGSKKVSIALFSDLHAGFSLSPHLLAQLQLTISNLRPDMILFAGDAVNYYHEAIAELENFFLQCRQIAPVVAVLGNHDHYDNADKVCVALQSWGVEVLRDAIYRHPLSGLVVVGAGDLEQEAGSHSALGAVADNERALLLAHHPDTVDRIDVAALQRVGLVLSGHTHGGQIRHAERGALVLMASQDRIYGWSQRPGMPPQIVTRGVGYTAMPVRINAPPELVIIEILP